jgi:cytochrome c556
MNGIGLNVIFAIVIIILFSIELNFIKKRSNKSIRSSILAIGIFGTFLGIFIGLQDFDPSPSKIDNSVFHLIEGLKLAFFTSLLGMGASIILTLIARFSESDINKKEEEDEIKRQFAFLENINRNIENMVVHISKLEKDFSNFIHKSQQTQDLSIIQEVVNELKAINEKIVDTKSVYNLVEETKQSVEKTGQKITTALDLNSKNFKTKIDEIGNNISKKIDKVSLDFDSAMQKFIKKIEKIFAKFDQSLLNAVNNIKNKIDEIGNNISKKIDEAGSNFDSSIKQLFVKFDTSLLNAVNNIENKVNGIGNNISKKIDETGSNFDSNIKELLVNVEQLFAKFDTSLSISLDNLSEKSANEIAQVLAYSVDRFNQTLLDNFGQNFKELNLAVEKMLDWQENYKSSIELTEQGLEKSLVAIEEFEKIMSKHDEVLKIFQQLQTIIKTFDTQTKTMSQHLKTYKTLGDEAKEMTPKIANFLDVVQKNIKHVDNQIANITDRFGNEYEIYIDSLKKLLQSIPKGK